MNDTPFVLQWSNTVEPGPPIRPLPSSLLLRASPQSSRKGAMGLMNDSPSSAIHR